MRFSIVRKAGLTATDLSRLLNVHRCTVSLWLNGHKKPHFLHAARVRDTLTDLQKSVTAGKLPAPELPRNPEERLAALRRILSRA